MFLTSEENNIHNQRMAVDSLKSDGILVRHTAVLTRSQSSPQMNIREGITLIIKTCLMIIWGWTLETQSWSMLTAAACCGSIAS